MLNNTYQTIGLSGSTHCKSHTRMSIINQFQESGLPDNQMVVELLISNLLPGAPLMKELRVVLAGESSSWLVPDHLSQVNFQKNVVCFAASEKLIHHFLFDNLSQLPSDLFGDSLRIISMRSCTTSDIGGLNSGSGCMKNSRC